MDRSNIDRRALLGAAAAFGAIGLPAGKSHAAGTFVAGSTVTTAPYVTVKTGQGTLRGGHSRGALAFKGIPYGTEITGKNRFKAATPAPGWSGVRDALSLGAPSPQKPNSTFGENEPAPDENCLVLNVWTPATGDGKKRPVMFYIHGGGYHVGSAGAAGQDGSHLAATYDVVVVAANHRLGLLGYMYLGDIGGDAYATSGNQSMLDLVLALRWVKDNVEAFGGDPHNVMIFGESGGGFKTGTLLAMPAARGLFHKASVESGAALIRMSRDQGTETATRVLRSLGIASDQLDKLADVPIQAFVDMQVGSEQGTGPLIDPSDPKSTRLHRANFLKPGAWGPVVDGVVLPTSPFDPVAAPPSADIPLMVGHNRDEATFFNMGRPETFTMDAAALKARLKEEFGGYAPQIEATYRDSHPTASPSQLYIAIASDVWFGNDALTAAERKSRQPAPVYKYRYDYQSNFMIPGTTYPFGAGHASEIAMKFYNYDIRGLHGDGAGVAAASRNMSEMWANFARTSKPSAKGQAAWLPFDLNNRYTMVIDSKCHLEADLDSKTRILWQGLGSAV